MDRVRHFLDDVRQRGLAEGNFLGLLNVLIGRRIAQEDGTPIAAGISWRELAAHFKRARWDKDVVSELGLDSEALPPRDRERYWFMAITRAGVDSLAASQAGDRFAHGLRALGYDVGPAPGNPPNSSPRQTNPPPK